MGKTSSDTGFRGRGAGVVGGKVTSGKAVEGLTVTSLELGGMGGVKPAEGGGIPVPPW